MPKILELLGKISVYMYREPNHRRMHLHVYKGNPKSPDAAAVISIGDWMVLENDGFSAAALRGIIDLVEPRTDEFIEMWEELQDEN